MDLKKLQNPRRILIVRFSAIGDVIHSVPMLVALRTRFPNTEIAWLTEEKNAQILNGHWALDRLILVQNQWMKSLAEIKMLRKRLRNFSPDVCIDPQSLLKSSVAAQLSGAKIRIGFGGKEGREGSTWLNNLLINADADHVIEKNLQLLIPFGVEGCSVDFDLPEREMIRRNVQKMLQREGLHGNFTILNVGAGWVSKLWREDRYAAVARYLLGQWNLPSLILWADNTEKKSAETVVDLADGAAILAPDTTLAELASLARSATLFIGSDTGPLHIAAGVGTHCIGLYGPMSAKQTGPYGFKNRSIQKRTLEKTRINPHHASRDLMDAIDIEDVCNVCDEVLSEILAPQQTLPQTTPFTEIVKRKTAA